MTRMLGLLCCCAAAGWPATVTAISAATRPSHSLDMTFMVYSVRLSNVADVSRWILKDTFQFCWRAGENGWTTRQPYEAKSPCPIGPWSNRHLACRILADGSLPRSGALARAVVPISVNARAGCDHGHSCQRRILRRCNSLRSNSAASESHLKLVVRGLSSTLCRATTLWAYGREWSCTLAENLGWPWWPCSLPQWCGACQQPHNNNKNPTSSS